MPTTQASRPADRPSSVDPSGRRYHVGYLAFLADVVAGGMAVGATAVTFGLTPWLIGVAAAWPLALNSVGAFNIRDILARRWAPKRVWAAMAKVLVVLAFAALLLPPAATASCVFMATMMGIMTFMARSALRSWIEGRHAEGELMVPILARGTSGEVRDFADLLRSDRAQPFRIAAVQFTEGPVAELGVPVLPSHLDPVDAAIGHGLAAVAFVGRQPEDSAELRRILWGLEAAGIDARMVPVVATMTAPDVDALGATGMPTLSFRAPDVRAESGFTKVVLDKLLALVGLILLAPLLGLIAVAIKRDSAGPVLFRQVRVGRDRVPFTMLKFRTMTVDAERLLIDLRDRNTHDSGVLFKIHDDPRVTSVGRFLRRYSLDELPQLVNVLLGEMSLVGPRPPLPAEVEHYPEDAHRRFRVRPGLTGLWQVSGRSNLNPVDSARLDTHYVEHWSPALDAQILAATARAVLSADGAY